ncbi:MAG: ribosome assembly cofactor RimP [Bacteroidales bacterium]
MIEKSKIEKLVNEYITGTQIFLVGVRISSSNRIIVYADTKEGITIDECAGLHRHIERGLDRNTEDYELQVSSPGLEMPFAVIEQYHKNEGSQVAVVDNEGQKFSGILRNVTDGGFDLETEKKVKGNGKEIVELPFNFDQVKTVKSVLIIK